MSRLLSDEEITTQLRELSGWKREGDAIVASVEAPDFPAAIQVTARPRSGRPRVRDAVSSIA